MKICSLIQSTPEWHQWRAQGITASEIDCLFGTNPYKTRWQLWAEKLGLRVPDDPSRNPYVRKGKIYEHALREFVSADRDLGIMPVCVEYDADPFIRASLDGIDRFRRPWEFKIPSERNFDDIRANGSSSVAARTYFPQLQAQILCTGAREGYLIFGRMDESNRREPRVQDYKLLIVEADAAMHRRILDEAQIFKSEITNRAEPAKDPDRDVWAPETDADADLWQQASSTLLPLLSEKEALEARLEQLKGEIEASGKPLIDVLQQNKIGEFSGLRVTRVNRIGNVDWQSYAKDKGDDPTEETVMSRYRKPGTTSYQFRSVF